MDGEVEEDELQGDEKEPEKGRKGEVGYGVKEDSDDIELDDDKNDE